MKAWYSRLEHENPTLKLTRVQDITIKMIGKASKPKLHIKGAETKWFMRFLRDRFRTLAEETEVRSWVTWASCFQSACRYVELADTEPWVVGADAHEELSPQTS